MNLNLPSLPTSFLYMLALVVLAAQKPSAQAQEYEPESQTAGKADGSQLVGQAARRVQAEPALSADLRYKIDAFGHELVGQGTYHQLGRGPEKLLRLELKVQVADQALTRQEICGPQFYWIRRESPFAAATLGRVNLRQVRQAAAQHQPDAPARESAVSNPADVWILLGGLPKLLEGLHDHFDFDPPTGDELQFTGADGQSIERLPVLIVRGRWKPKVLGKLLNGDPDKTKMPEQLPDEVELLLGRPEQVLPLFPYRVTYRKRAKSAGQGRGEELRPLMTMELFNVYRKGDIDPREFDYNPGDQEVADLTPGYLQRLGLAPKTR